MSDLPDPDYGYSERVALIGQDGVIRRVVDWNGDPATCQTGGYFKQVRMAELPEGVGLGWRLLSGMDPNGAWLPPEENGDA